MANARQAKSTREKAAQLRAEAERKAARKRAVLAGSLVVIVVILAVAAVIGVRSLQREASKAPANLTGSGYVYTAGGTAKPANGKVTVQLYEDFQCPVCKQFDTAALPMLTQYAKDGKITLEYHPVSILDRASSTNYSTRALNAWASVLNSSPKAVEAFQEALFANQPGEGTVGLTDAQLIDLAVKAGASASEVTSLIDDQTFKGWTRTVTDEFSRKGYTGTPTVVINGKVQDNKEPAGLKAAIDQAIAAQ